MTTNIGALSLASLLAIGLLGACTKEKGACIVTYADREVCRPDADAELCNAFATPGPSAPVKTRLEAITQEDRDRYETVKAISPDITAQICRRLGYDDCRMGSCQRRK
jgi:hypothetical protein